MIRKYVDVHGTVFLEDGQVNSVLPDFVKNHGLLSGPDLHRLLLESKVFFFDFFVKCCSSKSIYLNLFRLLTVNARAIFAGLVSFLHLFTA